MRVSVNRLGATFSVVLLLAVTVVTVRWARVPIAASAVVAVGRGIAQLALVSLPLGFALTQPWASVLTLTAMVITAILTSTGRLRADDRADVTAYVTLLADGNAMSLSTNDASNWSRIQIVDRAVASSAVAHAWIRAPWLGDPRNSDDNGADLELVSSLSAKSSSPDAFQASVRAYLAFQPVASSAVTAIDSALDE